VSDEESEDLAEAAREILENALPRELVTNYILICETVDEFGADLEIIANKDASPWLILGMLKYATGAVSESTHNVSEYDGEDFEGEG
jgi:hypothetical protein